MNRGRRDELHPRPPAWSLLSRILFLSRSWAEYYSWADLEQNIIFEQILSRILILSRTWAEYFYWADLERNIIHWAERHWADVSKQFRSIIQQNIKCVQVWPPIWLTHRNPENHTEIQLSKQPKGGFWLSHATCRTIELQSSTSTSLYYYYLFLIYVVLGVLQYFSLARSSF